MIREGKTLINSDEEEYHRFLLRKEKSKQNRSMREDLNYLIEEVKELRGLVEELRTDNGTEGKSER